MSNSKDVFNEVVSRISIEEDIEEITSIAYLLLREKFNISKTDILGEKSVDHVDRNKLDKYLFRINQSEPVQYILGKQEFYGRFFKVNSSVLIPRPETELLVSEIISLCKQEKIQQPRVLDVGTGSGCIPITLSLEWPGANTCGIDISRDAIALAEKNAEAHNVKVQFLHCDIFLHSMPPEGFDFVVSNPPYITSSEKINIKPNVLRYEPQEALFVPDDDPLLFYREIIMKGLESLKRNGWIVFEINEKFGSQVVALFPKAHFDEVKIVKDLSQKDRVVVAHLCE